MIFKHSIKSVIRTPKKTVLFLFLLIVLTISLSIGAGMYDSARNMLLDADKTFTSVVELNYLGDLGGDEVNFYKNMNLDLADFDFNQLEQHKDVRAVNTEKTAWAFIEGKTIKNNNTPISDYGMVKVSRLIKYEDNIYMGIVKEALFGRKVKDNNYVMINDIDDLGIPMNHNFMEGHEYLIIGRITAGRNPTPILNPGLPGPAFNIPYLADLTENPDYLLSDEGKQILKLQEAMKVVDSSIEVTMVSSLEASAALYNKELLFKMGRIFSQEEYQESKNKVILISEAVANFYQVKIGDMLTLKLHNNNTGIGLSDFLTTSKFNQEATYEVVGIFTNMPDKKYLIYMPQAPWLEQELHSKTLARYIVKNGSGAKFIKDNSKSLLPNMVFTLYDQGYAEAVKPIVALKNSAVLIILLGALAGTAILLLFAYLYVIKQKDTLKTMLSLGSGRKRTRNYILYGAAILVFCASLIGAGISFVFLNKITRTLFEVMKNSYGTDMRYSERSTGLQMNFVPQIRENLWLPVIVIIVIIAISYLLLSSFTYSVLQEDKLVSLHKGNKKEEFLLPRNILIRKMRFGRVRPITLKFALLSLTRSPGRSFIIPFISLILSIFIIFLGLLSRMQQEKLTTVYDRIPVTAYITTYKNETRDIAGIDLQYDIYLLIDPDYSYRLEYDKEIADDYVKNGEFTSLRAEEERDKILAASEYFKEMSLYTAVHYEYMGIAKTKEGEEDKDLSEVPNIRKHNNNYGFDWFLNKIKTMPKLAYADDLRCTPDFFNDFEPAVEFLEGYDFASLHQRENIGIVSQSFAAANSIENGDTIRITSWVNFSDMAAYSVIDLKVVGIYDEKWRTESIYIPWIMSYDHKFYIDVDFPTDTAGGGKMGAGTAGGGKMGLWNEILPRDVDAATFTLRNTEDLTSFRDYLEMLGYSQAGKISINRRAIVIQDKNLIETVQNLRNHIRLIDTIKPIMLILFGIIGFIVSYILIRHRMNEFAIMRSMGAKKRHVFFSFFLEQVLLFFVGLIPTAAYALYMPGKIGLYGLSLIYFILCYLTGTAFALIIMNRAKVMEALFTKE